jgi:hypothetical protein
MEEFLFYRKKFEKSQRAKASMAGGANSGKQTFDGNLANLDLNEEMFDPKNMQQQI